MILKQLILIELFYSPVEDRIVIFLHSCYYKLEATKNTIESYFSIRSHATDLFSNRDPCSKEIQEALETM